MKKILTLVSMFVVVFSLTGCGLFGEDDSNFTELDKDIVGEITIMSWAGDDYFHKDIGHDSSYTAESMTNGKVAEMVAVAKAFNKIYPNVKVNFRGEPDGPDAWGPAGAPNWEQRIETFKQSEGYYPSIFNLTDVPGTIARGLISDLSQFEEDELYQTLNPELMEAANYYGMQSSLPGYFMPHGVFVNTGLISDENLETPDSDWTYREYKTIANESGNSDGDTYLGTSQHPETWARQMFVTSKLTQNPVDGKYVDLNNQDLIDFYTEGMASWHDNQMYNRPEAIAVPDEISSVTGWAGEAFSLGRAVLHPEEPWWVPVYSDKEGWLPGPAEFDLLPFPSYKEHDNTIATTLDPVGVYNYKLDGDPFEYTDTEKLQTQLAYTFLAFSIADTRAWEARAEAEYTDAQTGNRIKGTLGPFPSTSGDVFDEQLQIWLDQPKFSYYQGKPGFEGVVDILRTGGYTAFTDKLYPWYYTDEDTGARVPILSEFFGFQRIASGADSTVTIGGAGWEDEFVSKLSSWETLSNERFAKAWEDLRADLVEYYDYDEDDARFSE